MSVSKSHSTNLERLHELTERQEYLNEFFDKMMVALQRPSNTSLLKSQPYVNMMRKLSFVQELRGKFNKRGNSLSTLQDFSPEELEELHFIRNLDSGHIDSMWESIREFIDTTGLNVDIDESRT